MKLGSNSIKGSDEEDQRSSSSSSSSSAHLQFTSSGAEEEIRVMLREMREEMQRLKHQQTIQRDEIRTLKHQQQETLKKLRHDDDEIEIGGATMMDGKIADAQNKQPTRPTVHVRKVPKDTTNMIHPESIEEDENFAAQDKDEFVDHAAVPSRLDHANNQRFGNEDQNKPWTTYDLGEPITSSPALQSQKMKKIPKAMAMVKGVMRKFPRNVDKPNKDLGTTSSIAERKDTASHTSNKDILFQDNDANPNDGNVNDEEAQSLPLRLRQCDLPQNTDSSSLLLGPETEKGLNDENIASSASHDKNDTSGSFPVKVDEKNLTSEELNVVDTCLREMIKEEIREHMKQPIAQNTAGSDDLADHASSQRKSSAFSIIPTSDNRVVNENEHALEEDTFALMMLNKPYSPIRVPQRIMTECIRAVFIAGGIFYIILYAILMYLDGFYPYYLIIMLIGLGIIVVSSWISPLCSRILYNTILRLSGPWTLALVSLAIFQLTLGISIIVDQWTTTRRECENNKGEDDIGECIPFDIPFRVGPEVNTAQFITVVLVLATQSDILTSIQTVWLLRNADHIPWDRVIGEEGNRTWRLWIFRILLPNILEFTQGVVILFASFIIIVQSTRVIDLLKDFTALLVVSEADNIMFHLTDLGYLGEHLASKTAEAKAVRWTVPDKEERNGVENDGEDDIGGDNAGTNCRQRVRSLLNLRVCIFVGLCSMMVGGLSYCVAGQWNGRWMRTKYPECNVQISRFISDGDCFDRHPYNSDVCGWDGGDCPDRVTVEGYPNCTVSYPHKIGDGWCETTRPYNSEACGWDGGDCIPKAVEGYPECFVIQAYHGIIGNGNCEEWYLPAINTEECGWDGGDCPVPVVVEGYPNCKVSHPEYIGNGYCDDYPPYNSEVCGYDGGDCNPKDLYEYSGCRVQYSWKIGNGGCDNYAPYNTAVCGYDGGDCPPPPPLPSPP